MKSNLIRSSYYNADYPLNSQEIQEFALTLEEPYWLAKYRAFALGVDCSGDKHALRRRTEQALFHNDSLQLPPSSEARKNRGEDYFSKQLGVPLTSCGLLVNRF